MDAVITSCDLSVVRMGVIGALMREGFDNYVNILDVVRA